MNDEELLKPTGQQTVNLKSEFAEAMIGWHSMTNVISKENINYKTLKADAIANITALNPTDNLQIMLAAQMISVHVVQQRTMPLINNAYDPDILAKYTNTITKLSNVFIQQVNLMQKLKGEVEKKIIIEHVHVNNGGQAVVGSIINTAMDPGK